MTDFEVVREALRCSRMCGGLNAEADSPCDCGREEALAALARIKTRLEEREADMHQRIRAGYDKTVADSWRAKVAEVEAERDAARAVRVTACRQRDEATARLAEVERERDAAKARSVKLVLERDAEHARYMEAHTAAETLRSDLRRLQQAHHEQHATLQAREEEIRTWRAASGLEVDGSTDAVTPEHLLEEFKRRDLALAEAEKKRADLLRQVAGQAEVGHG